MEIRIARLFVLLVFCTSLFAQGQRGQRGGPPPAARDAAPIDLTGYWVSIVSEDWNGRMFPRKGDFGGFPGGNSNIPFNAEGRRVALAWDAAKDDPCKAYGAAGVMRQPGRLHITWQDDSTLRVDTDAGNQSRLFRFSMPQPISESTSQGVSFAQWTALGGRQNWARGGYLKVVTTQMKPGYYWRNGTPYSGDARMTEYFRVTSEPTREVFLNMSEMVEDPQLLTQPYIVTYHFRKEPDGSKWSPRPCAPKD